jgi:hypothetical protein
MATQDELWENYLKQAQEVPQMYIGCVISGRCQLSEKDYEVGLPTEGHGTSLETETQRLNIYSAEDSPPIIIRQVVLHLGLDRGHETRHRPALGLFKFL